MAVVLPCPLSAQQSPHERAVLKALASESVRAIELARLRDEQPPLEHEPVYQGLWLRESDAPDSLVFDLLPFASAPRRADGIALAYDMGMGSRMWSGFTHSDPVSSALLGTAAQAVLGAWRLLSNIEIGPHDLLAAHPCPGMRVRLGMEALNGFGTDGRDVPEGSRALIVGASCARDLGGSWNLTAGLRGYDWRSPAAPDRQELETSVRVAHAPPGDALLLFADASWTPSYERVVLHVERPVTVSRFHLRPLVRIAWARDVPFGLGFWPGGFDGFPGLKAGEARGDRETTAAVDIARPIRGKLSARTLLAAGRTWNGGPLLGGPPWLLGVRAGLDLDTRYGLVRVEYGIATGGHHAFFVRLGRIL
jgi:hypothetical protein